MASKPITPQQILLDIDDLRLVLKSNNMPSDFSKQSVGITNDNRSFSFKLLNILRFYG